MKMNFSNLIAGGRRLVSKHAPEILIFLGIGGGVTAGVMACKATRKLDDVLDEHTIRLEQARKDADAEKNSVAKAYLATGAALVRLYGPSIAVGALSITSILSGNNVLRRRNVALAAAYATVDQSYRAYRGRVAERFGEDVERELRGNLQKTEIEETIVDDKGKTKKVKREVCVANGMPSDYARYFTYPEAKAAEPNMAYNQFFLRTQQTLANTLLRSRKYLFLNDVYDMLGIERSVAGQCVGWVYDPDRDDHGDNLVDFGMQVVHRADEGAPGGYEEVILLDFNVDGEIWNHSLEKGLITE